MPEYIRPPRIPYEVLQGAIQQSAAARQAPSLAIITALKDIGMGWIKGREQRAAKEQAKTLEDEKLNREKALLAERTRLASQEQEPEFMAKYGVSRSQLTPENIARIRAAQLTASTGPKPPSEYTGEMGEPGMATQKAPLSAEDAAVLKLLDDIAKGRVAQIGRTEALSQEATSRTVSRYRTIEQLKNDDPRLYQIAFNMAKEDPTWAYGSEDERIGIVNRFFDEVKARAGGTKAGRPGSKGAKTIRVRQKSTGQTGTIPESEFDAKIYERL